MLFGKIAGKHAACVGLMLVTITLTGVIAHANAFSFLMVICLGTPGLLLLLDTLLA
jgi:hypothetical protein